jgi:Novel STAND NTPase 1
MRDCPYAGLMPFTEEQADFFFGREAEREIITANLMASRLTLLYGPSGVGKSSVLNAGVVHHLRTEAAASRANVGRGFSPGANGRPEFGIVTFRTWRGDPLVGLEHAIANEVGKTASGSTFADRLHDATTAVTGDLLIILDQFEEYFLYHSTVDGEGTFAVEFPRAVNRPDLRVSFLVSMREDSIAKLDFFKGRIPNLFDNYLRIDHLERDQARDAIVKPIEQFNKHAADGSVPMRIEPALVDMVLNQVTTGRVAIAGTGKGRLGKGANGHAPDERVETPYLQLVLTRLWQEETAAGSHELRAATLERLGGAGHIVATHLDAALQALTPEEQNAAAAIFQYLVTPSGTKIALGLDDLAQYAKRKREEIQPLLVRLSSGENRILIPVAPPPDQPARESYQIFHDVLAAAVLEWRNRYTAAAEKREADARAEEQRLRAEREAEAAARLRKQRRLLFILLTASGVLLFAVLVLSYFASLQRRQLQETALKLKALQEEFFAADARVNKLMEESKVAQNTAVQGFKEAQHLFEEAADLARKGNTQAAQATLARATQATQRAEVAQDTYEQLNTKIVQEQKKAGDVKAQAEDLSKTLPTGGGVFGKGAGNVLVTPPPPVGTKQPENPPTPVKESPPPNPPPAGNYRDTFRKAMEAKDRRRWAQARDLFQQAIQQNGTESTEKINVSGFGGLEEYLPKYHLGIAFKNLKDCGSALKAWADSEKDGAVQRIPDAYKSLQRERDNCEKGK